MKPGPTRFGPRHPRGTLAAVAALLLATALLGCPDRDAAEWWRRSLEGGVTTAEARADVAATIASLEAHLAGPGSPSLAERMAFHRTPGVAIAVVRGGRVEWTEAYGTWDTTSGVAVDRYSPFQAASVSKPTTALGILLLVAQGRLDLDAPVNDTLSAWQVPDSPHTVGNPVTLRQILSHTAGFNVSGFIGYAPGQALPTLLEVLGGAGPANHPPIRVEAPPGSRWLYSGGGYTVLAQLIEDVTGEPMAGWMAANVLAPLGMQSSHFEQPSTDSRVVGATPAHLFGGATPAFRYPELPAAGLWATALDLGRLIVGIQRSVAGAPGALLPPGVAAELITPQRPAPNPLQVGLGFAPQMGLGLFLVDGNDPGWFWHTGSNTGFQCLIVGDTRGLGHGVAVMTNGWPGGRLLAWEVVNAVADLNGWPVWNDWGV